MMKIKSLGILGMLSLVLLACSESSYTPVGTTANGQIAPNGVVNPYQTGYGQPVNGQPYVNGQPNVNGPVYNPNSPFNQPNNVNPYILGQNPMQMNAQAQMQFQLHVAAMSSCQARLQAPYFYYQKSISNNCAFARQVTYTPNSCACYKAPCNCERVIEQVRAHCPSVQRTQTTTVETETTTTTTAPTCRTGCATASATAPTAPTTSTAPSAPAAPSTSTGPVAPVSVATAPAAPAATEHPDAVTAAHPCGATPCGVNEMDEGANLVIPTILNEDAQALYQRLAKRAEPVKDAKGNKTTTLIGKNYKCIMEGKGKKPSEYACEMVISGAAGAVMMQDPESPSGLTALKSPGIFSGPAVNAGGPPLSMNEGIITIDGDKAKIIYNKMNAEEKPGTFDKEQTVQALVKTTQHIKCSATLGAVSSHAAAPTDDKLLYKCTLHIKLDDGSVLAPL